MDLDTFIILCRGLFLPEFLSNRSLCFGEVCYDFSKSYVMFFGIFFRIFWFTMWINVGTLMYLSAEAHAWILACQYRGPLSEATRQVCTLWAPSTFNQLKYRGLYPIMLQCGASIAEAFSALNQHWVFDMNSRTFKMLHFNIELTLVIASNTKRRRNVVLMFGKRHRQWYINKLTKKSVSRNLKFQSIFHNINNPTIFKMVAKKRTKRSPNIFVTWNVTIPLQLLLFYKRVEYQPQMRPEMCLFTFSFLLKLPIFTTLKQIMLLIRLFTNFFHCWSVVDLLIHNSCSILQET